MRSVPAAKFITDLGPKKEAAPPAPRREERESGPEALQLFAVQDKTPPQNKTATAYAEGFAAGQAAAEAEWQPKLDELRAFHEKQLSVERLTWAGREADALAEQLVSGLQQLETTIADTVAELLKPFLVKVVHDRAINDLLRAIDTVLMKDEAIALEISGPEDLLQMLREKLSGKNIAIVFTPGDGPEIRIATGQTALETQIRAWTARIEESLR
jgi:hypothetical protein